MKKPYLLPLIFILQITILCAQENVSVNKNEFRTDKPGFDAAWNHIKDGDSFYSRGGIWYSRALDEYKIAYVYNKLNAELNYKIGVSALFSDRKEEAADYLKNAYGLKNNVAEDILLLTGRALIYKASYAEAEDKINMWLSAPLKKPESDIKFANRLLEECRSGILITKDTVRLEINNSGGSLNSNADDYSVVLSPDGRKMFFASRRSLKPKESSHYRDTKYNENIFLSVAFDGKWNEAMLAGKNLVTDLCETPLYLDKSGSLLYIYTGYEGGGNIKVSEFRKGEWKAPANEKIGINTDAAETSLSISPDGNEIAFISDRGKKGAGGKDIYFIHRKGNKWSKPSIAEDSLNSKYDEESVCYSKGGDTLWFSSMGHNTLGGFDIFYSVRNKSRRWGAPVNAGYPLNTAWDDMFYVPSPINDSIFYFSSNRSGGLGGLDIYSGKILPPVLHKILTQPKIDTAAVKDTSAVVKMNLPVTTKADTVPAIKPDSVAVKDSSAVIKKLPSALLVPSENRLMIPFIKDGMPGREFIADNSFARDPNESKKQLYPKGWLLKITSGVRVFSSYGRI